MENNRRIGALLSYIYIAVNVIVQMIYVPLLLNSIGQDEFGIYQLVGSIMAYVISINGVLSAGVGRFYCKSIAENDFQKAENTLAVSRRIYWAMSIIAMVVVYFLTLVFRRVYSDSFSSSQLDECTAMLFVLGINTVVTMNNSVSIAAITAHERFVFLKLSSLAVLVIQPFLVIALTNYYPSALTVTLVVLAMNSACAVVQGLYRRNVLNIGRRYYGWDSKLAKALMSFSGGIIMVTIADQIFWKTDQLIVGYLFGAEFVAVYSVGSQIYQMYMGIGSAAGAVFLPRVSELFHRNHDLKAMSDLFIKFGRLNCLLLMFVLCGYAIFGLDFISMWVGDGYSDAYLIALIVMIPFTIDLIQNLGLTILQVTNQYYFRGVMYLVVAILNVFLTLFLLSIWGLPGAAVSTAIAMFIGNGLIMNWYYSHRVGLDISRFWKEIAQIVLPALFATALAGVVYYIAPIKCERIAWFLFGCVVYGLLFALSEWLFGMNAYEKGLIKSFTKKVMPNAK